MTSAKTLLFRRIQGEPLTAAQWWASVVNDPRFDLVLTCGRAELMEMLPSQPQIEGAELLIGVMASLPVNEPTPTEFPSPGLHHHFDVAKKPAEATPVKPTTPN